jgi:hypothetical protein
VARPIAIQGFRGTPGEWRYVSGEVVTPEGASLIRANRDEPRTAPRERDANVRACSAVPLMLAALMETRALLDKRAQSRAKWTTRDQNAYDAIERAIAAALGAE